MMILFTDYVPSQEVKYNIGWIMISLILFNVFINICLIVYQTFLKLVLTIFKYVNLIQDFLKKRKNIK